MKNFLTVLVASVAGFLGAMAASPGRSEASAATVIRAEGFELVGAEGKLLARLEPAATGGAHLLLLTKAQKPAIEVGVSQDGRPIFRMWGHDDKTRVVIELDELDKPVLSMGDERWLSRVSLGFLGPDMKSRDWDAWGVAFQYLSQRPLSSIGVAPGTRGLEGFLTVNGRRIR